jgi:O-antigen/teichoic acid export membrane protein
MLIRNAVFRWVGLLTEVAVGLLTTPLLVRHLGEEAYGVWLVVVSTAALFGFLDLGLASAVTKHLSADLARGDRDSAWATVSNSLTLYLAIAVLVAASYMALAWWGAPLFNWGPEFATDGRPVLIIMGLCVAVSFFNNLFEGIVIARERQHLVGMVEAGVSLARLAGLYLAVTVWGGLWAVGVAHVLVTLAGYLVMFRLGAGAIDLGRRLRPGWDRRRGPEMLAYGRDSLLISLGQRLRQDGPVLLTGSLAGPALVPFLGVGLRLLGYMISLVHLAVGVALPRFSAFASTQDQAHSRELLLRSSLYSSLMASFMALTAAFLVEPFVMVWLGGSFVPAVRVVWLLLGPLGLYMALRPCEVLLYGLGRHRFNGLLYLGETVVMAGLCWLAIGPWGAEGAAASLGVALLLLRPWLLPSYVCRQVSLGLGAYWLKGPGRAALAGALAALPVGVVLSLWPPRSWPGLMAAGLALAALAAPVFWRVGFDARERAFWREWLKERRGGRRDV